MFKEDYINISLMVILMSIALVCLAILNCGLLQFNYNIGVSFCALLNIPHDLTLTVISPGFLYSFCTILYIIEIAVFVKLYNFIKNCFINIFNDTKKEVNHIG